jgi:hypothetical protein
MHHSVNPVNLESRQRTELNPSGWAGPCALLLPATFQQSNIRIPMGASLPPRRRGQARLDRHAWLVFRYPPKIDLLPHGLNAVEDFFTKLAKRRLKRACADPRRSPHCEQPLSGRGQSQALHLNRRSRQDHRRRQTRVASVGFDPLVPRSNRLIHGRSAQSRRPGRSHAEELNHLTGSEH